MKKSACDGLINQGNVLHLTGGPTARPKTTGPVPVPRVPKIPVGLRPTKNHGTTGPKNHGSRPIFQKTTGPGTRGSRGFHGSSNTLVSTHYHD